MRGARILSATVVALTIPLAGPAEAAYYHDLQKNRQPCSDCHISHYKEGSPKVDPGGPFGQLIARATTNKLCLFCHDGSDPKAPDVLAPVTMYAGSGDEHSGAGFFGNSGGVDNPNGHDLGVNKPIPSSSRGTMTLTCASCHDPHGTPNYRNVVTAPAGGAGTGVVMGEDVYREVPPGDPPSAAASIAAYKESNEGYKASTSRWCIECHDAAAQGSHRVDVPINGAGYPTNPAHWAAGTGSGFGVTTGDGVEGVPRLRFQAAGATDFASSKIVSEGNQVMCATCHFAHGGTFRRGFVWPYLDAGSADSDSGCLQCHDY